MQSGQLVVAHVMTNLTLKDVSPKVTSRRAQQKMQDFNGNPPSGSVFGVRLCATEVSRYEIV